MLDHVFTDAISALREAFEEPPSFLERQAFEEHFQVDVLLGDVTWETSYGLPGEGDTPGVEAHITFLWPTWSQTAYRRWYLDETLDEAPAIEMEIVFRIQRLAAAATPELVLGVLAEQSPPIGGEPLERGAVTVETSYAYGSAQEVSHAVEVAYAGLYELPEEALADGSSDVLDRHFRELGGWISFVLVRLGELKLEYLPPEG